MSISSVNQINSVAAPQEIFKSGDQHNLTRQQEADYKTALEAAEKNNSANVNSKEKEDTGHSYSNEKLRELSDALVGFNKSLIIEKDPESVGYIYKTIDKSTGEVVKVWPEAQFLDKVASLQDVDARGVLMNKLV